MGPLGHDAASLVPRRHSGAMQAQAARLTVVYTCMLAKFAPTSENLGPAQRPTAVQIQTLFGAFFLSWTCAGGLGEWSGNGRREVLWLFLSQNTYISLKSHTNKLAAFCNRPQTKQRVANWGLAGTGAGRAGPMHHVGAVQA